MCSVFAKSLSCYAAFPGAFMVPRDDRREDATAKRLFSLRPQISVEMLPPMGLLNCKYGIIVHKILFA